MINTKMNFNAIASIPPVLSTEELRINAWTSSENGVAKRREKNELAKTRQSGIGHGAGFTDHYKLRRWARPLSLSLLLTRKPNAVYKQLRDKGEIIESSPLYDTLKPIADAIAREAQPRYPHPFKFFLVHETQPNAFATPGGNVYVVDSLLYFVKNTEQLAGTLCHEVSHTIHRDGVALMEKEQKIERREVAAAILLGPTRAHIIAIALIGKLHSLGYSREAESNADVTGSDICAAAGYNPWGLTWLFQDFQNADIGQVPQLLSDHPANGTRIKTLEKHFQDNPSVFSKFNHDPKSATPFSVPKDAPEVFLHADTKEGN